jgi:hypothetical protein
MSRPFSYHDEDMDVIGNILFIHSYIPYATFPGVPMCRIPPEVLKRITQTWNVAFLTNESKYPVSPVVISDDAFFATQDHYNTPNINRWIYCWYPLKDI